MSTELTYKFVPIKNVPAVYTVATEAIEARARTLGWELSVCILTRCYCFRFERIEGNQTFAAEVFLQKEELLDADGDVLFSRLSRKLAHLEEYADKIKKAANEACQTAKAKASA